MPMTPNAAAGSRGSAFLPDIMVPPQHSGELLVPVAPMYLPRHCAWRRLISASMLGACPSRHFRLNQRPCSLKTHGSLPWTRTSPPQTPCSCRTGVSLGSAWPKTSPRAYSMTRRIAAHQSSRQNGAAWLCRTTYAPTALRCCIASAMWARIVLRPPKRR